MGASPFTKLDFPVLGANPSEFACIQCGEDSQSWFVMAMRHESDRASALLAYALCARCGALYWEEAARKYLEGLRENLRDL